MAYRGMNNRNSLLAFRSYILTIYAIYDDDDDDDDDDIHTAVPGCREVWFGEYVSQLCVIIL